MSAFSGSIHDLRQSARRLVRRPAYSGACVLILALGIAAGTVVFTLVDSVLLRPPAWDRDESVVYLWRELPGGRMRLNAHPVENLELYRTADTLAGVAAYRRDTVPYFDGETPQRLDIAHISPELQTLIGMEPILGRLFTSEDEPLRRVLLEEGFWRERFGADTEVLGQTVELDEELYEIVGVLPTELAFPTRVSLMVPLDSREAAAREIHPFVVGRLAPEVPLTAAQAELEGIFEQRDTTGEQFQSRLFLQSASDYRHQRSEARLLWMLFGGVGLLVLAACANTAGLALTRAIRRRDEIGVRRALGASRMRLVRELLCENLILSVAGVGAGLLAATALLPVAVSMAPEAVRSGAATATIWDPRVLAFVLGLGLATTLAVTLLPALKTTKARTSQAGSSRSSTGGRGIRRSGTLLAATQVALATALLFAAGLLLRSFERAVSVDPGFEMEGLLAVDLDLHSQRFESAAARGAFHEEVRARLEGIPGFEGLAVTTSVPPEVGLAAIQGIEAEDAPAVPSEEASVMPSLWVGPEYFRTLGVPIVRGRGFDEALDAGIHPIIVSPSVATRVFGDAQSAVGRTLRVRPEQPWHTVVGVAGEVKQSGPADYFEEMELYYPYLPEERGGSLTLVVRTNGDPTLRIAEIRETLWGVDAKLPIQNLRSVDDRWSDAMADSRLLLTLIGQLTLVTVLLSLFGLHALLSFTVAARTREIGIRMALGADRLRVRWLVLRQAAVAGVLGLLVGLALTRAGLPLIRSQLFETSPLDPLAGTAAVGAVLAVVCAASWFPSRRATRVEPVESLRAE